MKNALENQISVNWLPQTIAVAELKPFEQNPRKISWAEFQKLKRSIQEDGYHQRIICTPDYRVIGGHQRIKALTELGIESIEVLVSDRALSDDQFKRILVRDNLNYGEWNIDALGELMSIGELQEIGVDESVVNKLDTEIIEGNTDPDEIPELPTAVTASGDVWRLGEHRVMCGDCTKADEVAKLMAGREADMLLTDPPYNTGMSAKKNSGSTWLTHMFDDSFTPEKWEQLLSGFCAAADQVMRKGAFLFVFLDWRRSHELVPQLKKFWSFSNLIVWDKVVHGLGSDYKYTHEFIHVCKKGKPPLASNKNGEDEYQDIWHIQRKVGHDDDHATKKPVELLERAIFHASAHGEIILDTFLGSGSTLLAAERTGRVCYGMELLPAYCDITVKRWEAYTGKKAERIAA